MAHVMQCDRCGRIIKDFNDIKVYSISTNRYADIDHLRSGNSFDFCELCMSTMFEFSEVFRKADANKCSTQSEVSCVTCKYNNHGECLHRAEHCFGYENYEPKEDVN